MQLNAYIIAGPTKFANERGVLPTHLLLDMGLAHVLVFLGCVGAVLAVDCDQHQTCALGALREAIVNHRGNSKNHSLIRAMLRYKAHPDCKDTDQVAQIQAEKFPGHVSVHPPQCESRFSFTTAEGFIGHIALIFNVALATLWYDAYAKRIKEDTADSSEKEGLLQKTGAGF